MYFVKHLDGLSAAIRIIIRPVWYYVERKILGPSFRVFMQAVRFCSGNLISPTSPNIFELQVTLSNPAALLVAVTDGRSHCRCSYWSCPRLTWASLNCLHLHSRITMAKSKGKRNSAVVVKLAPTWYWGIFIYSCGQTNSTISFLTPEHFLAQIWLWEWLQGVKIHLKLVSK